MPLLTARDFPGINAVEDNSGLAQGIFTALQGIQQRSKEKDLERKALIQSQLETAGAQALRIRDMASTSSDPAARRKAHSRQRAELSRMLSVMTRNGEDTSLFDSILEQTDPDQFNLALTSLATRAADGSKVVNRALGGGDRANFQQGQTRFAKDENDNLFQVSAAFDPNDASTQGLVTPINHDNAPVGKLEIVSRAGLTPEAKVEQVEAIEEIKTEETIKRETGKKGVALEWDARIAEQVELAKAGAKDRGEALNDLDQMEATLPTLKESIAELRELAEIATFTTGGRAFDLLVKETGFGATEGATARAKFIAIVNNQVLPLLRPTFGAAFTVPEGDSLRATMGDPNATPEEKMVQLDAFIEQKERDIRSKQKRLDPTDPGIAEGATATNPETGEKIIFKGGQWQAQ